MSAPAELAANVERRRPGEVALGVIGDSPGFAWVTSVEARAFAFRILVAVRESEDLLRAVNR